MTIFAIVAKSSRYNSSGLLLRISSGNIGDHPLNPLRIEHTSRTLQAVADCFAPVGEERPYHIGIPVPVIDGKDRVIPRNYFHNRGMHLGFWGETIRRQFKTALQPSHRSAP